MFKKTFLAVSMGLVFSMSGCGGGGGDTPETLTGVFEDSRVIGLNYQTASGSGVTNSRGEFQYQTGETITFSLGDILLGSTTGGSNLNTFNIGDSFERDSTTGEYTDIRIATLLQTLDSNFNPADGFIDLTGMVNNTSGLTLDNGVTPDLIEAIINDVNISEEVSIKSNTEVLNHATRSYYDAISEENKQLILRSILQQEDIDTGHYKVGTSVGIIADDEFITPGANITIQSDLTITGHKDLASGRLRNRIALRDNTHEYGTGLGLRYTASTNSYGINFFVEEYDVNTGQFIQNISASPLPAINDVVIEKDTSYTVKLEYSASEETINGYINGNKVLTALLPTSNSFNKAKVFVEGRVSAPRDSMTGAGVSAGAELSGIVDNLKITTTPENGTADVLLSDNFDNNYYDNLAINYSNRYRR